MRDQEDELIYLPANMPKRYCYNRYCKDRGYRVKTSCKGTTTLEKMDDHDGEYKDCVTWSFYHNHWKTEFPNLKVNRPSEDICGLCFQFYNKHKVVMKNTLLSSSKGTGEEQEGVCTEVCIPATNTTNATTTTRSINNKNDTGRGREENTVSTCENAKEELNLDLIFHGGGITVTDDEEEAANDPIENERELTLLKAATHVKAARAQRKLFNEKVKMCRESNNVRILVVNYGQNMQMPWFGSVQPGETYYYSPLNVSNLGIVDCFNDTLYAHVYHEGEGKKGGNNVASLIFKQLQYFGWIPYGNEESPSKDDELNIIFDNCPGQNKNNHVLRLVPYLVESRMFLKVNFIFLVVGHTKNAADRMFNTMKKKHRKSNAFTMKELCDGLDSEKVNVIRLEKDDMKDWDGMLGKFYRKYPKIEEYHIFSCNWNDQAHTNKNLNVNVKESNVEGSQMYSFNSIKQGIEGRSSYPSGNKELLAVIEARRELM